MKNGISNEARDFKNETKCLQTKEQEKKQEKQTLFAT